MTTTTSPPGCQLSAETMLSTTSPPSLHSSGRTGRATFPTKHASLSQPLLSANECVTMVHRCLRDRRSPANEEDCVPSKSGFEKEQEEIKITGSYCGELNALNFLTSRELPENFVERFEPCKRRKSHRQDDRIEVQVLLF